ncbi:MAG: DMT family transporter [Methanocorpusculum sp.]|nr:DMT family transporter [Methanocorpusculum sp.]
MNPIARFIFPILVFLGGCCYGPSSPTIKLAYEAGYVFDDVVMSQYFFGWLILALLTLAFFVYGIITKKPKREIKSPFTIKKGFGIFLAGVSIALVSLTYVIALQTVPAYIAVILLFQFTWIGVIFQAIAERRLPEKKTVIAVIILIFGTLLASGIIGVSVELNPIGVFFGFLSAVFYALYMFLLGRVEVSMHPLNRSFLIMTCALILLICIFSPAYFVSGVIFDGLWTYGIILGSIGCAVPMFLFAVGAPKISTGAATILSSSELPASIICAMIILSEAVSVIQWIGIILLFFGIALPYIFKGKGIHGPAGGLSGN